MSRVEETTRVLIIDDNESNVRLFAKVLRRLPLMSISTASNGEEAKLVAAESTPDLIMLDVNLPDVEGTDLLKYFKDTPSTAKAPVFIVSADSSEETISEFMESGAYDYITKPISIMDLLSRIQLGIDSIER